MRNVIAELLKLIDARTRAKPFGAVDRATV